MLFEVGTPQRNLFLSQIFTAIFISIVNNVANWYTRFEKSGIFFGYLVGKVLVWYSIFLVHFENMLKLSLSGVKRKNHITVSQLFFSQSAFESSVMLGLVALEGIVFMKSQNSL